MDLARLHFLQQLNFVFQQWDVGLEIFVAGLLFERRLNFPVELLGLIGSLQEGLTEIISVI